MGYWEQTKKGRSFAKGTGLIWGDEPADAFDDAIEATVKAFKTEFERIPTKTEIRAGLEFALSCYKEEYEQ